MSIAQKLYPNEPLQWISDYQPIINYFGEIIIQIQDSNYQGDARVLLQMEEMYGILLFGWGSCTCCDALRGCKTWEEVDSLIDTLRQSIISFKEIKDIQKYLEETNWDIKCYDMKTTRLFVDLCKLWCKNVK